MSPAFRESIKSPILSHDLSTPLPDLVLPRLASVEGEGQRCFSINGDPENAHFTLIGLGMAVTNIRQARADGKLIHSMVPSAKIALNEFGLSTIVEPRYPARRREFRKGQRTEKTLGTVGIRAFESLNFEAPTVEKLEAIFDIVGLQMHNVHEATTDDGRKAVVERTDFVFSSFSQAEALRGVFDDWLRTKSSRNPYRVQTLPMRRTGNGPWNIREQTGLIEGDWAVVVHGLDEYAMREMASASGEMQIIEDAKQFLAMRAPGKQAPPLWFGEGTETFPKPMYDRWARRDQKYQDIPVWASYGLGSELELVNKQRSFLLSTEITHTFQAFRDGIRKVVKAIHGENVPEINPNEDELLVIFSGLNLVRDSNLSPETHLAPPMPHAPSGIEKGRMQSMELLAEFRAEYRRHRLKALGAYGAKYGPKLAGAAVGLGIETGVEALVQAAPWAGRAGKSFLDDMSILSQRKRNALAAGTRVDIVADHLEAEYLRLAELYQ